MVLSSVKEDNLSLSDKAAEQVIHFIRENRLQRGDRLPNEKELVTQLNVSRSTIREAMRSLSSRGIVVIKQGSGTYIAGSPGVAEDPLGLQFKYDKPKVLCDLSEIRLMLEPSVAELCAKRVTDEGKAQLMMLNHKIAECILAGVDHIEYDVLFHCKIAECAGNDVLTVLFSEIVKGIRLFSQILETRIVMDVIGDHERIARTICEGDAPGARDAMLTHMLRNKMAIEEYLKNEEAKEQ